MLYTDTPGLSCDEAHQYHIDGTRPLGVSEVMEDLGFESGEWYDDTDSSRGVAIHAVLAGTARGLTFDWDLLDPDLHGWCRSGMDYLAYLLADGAVILGVEVRRYHPLYRYAGTIDLVVLWRGYEWVLDWKSGKASRVVRFKLAAYDQLLGPAANGKPRKRAAIEVQQDGSRAKLVEYNGVEYHHDANRFLGYLGTSRDRQVYAVKKILS
ncbi:MAG: hypothetical protein PHS14_00060 [Elusimicrobia bacterium]|nr:hypothetical protein [Elusimicrobiota bacterium]